MYTPCLYTFSASTFIQPVHSFSQYIHSASSTFLKELFLNDLFLPFCYDLGYLLPSVCLLLIGGHVHICNNMASSIMKTLDLDYIFAQKETQKDHPQRISWLLMFLVLFACSCYTDWRKIWFSTVSGWQFLYTQYCYCELGQTLVFATRQNHQYVPFVNANTFDLSHHLVLGLSLRMGYTTAIP